MSNIKEYLSGSLVSSEKHPLLRVGKISEVSSITKMSPSTIRAKMRAGEFPASMRLSYKVAVWNLNEVEDWFLEKLKTAPLYVPNSGGPKSNGLIEVANG